MSERGATPQKPAGPGKPEVDEAKTSDASRPAAPAPAAPRASEATAKPAPAPTKLAPAAKPAATAPAKAAAPGKPASTGTAASPKPAAAAKPAVTAPAKPAAPAGPADAVIGESFFPPPGVIDKGLKGFLEERLQTGEPFTIESKKTTFTGRLFRMALKEGWIALEHIDGRRKAFIIISGGTIRTSAGEEIPLPTIPAK